MGLEKLLEFNSEQITVQFSTLRADIEAEVKLAFETLKEKVELKDEKLDDITPVVEQELDPETYSTSEYAFEMEYNGQTVKGNYDTYEAKEGENEISYEHKLLEDAQEVAHNVHEAHITNRTYIEVAFDEKTKSTVTQMKIHSTAMWWVMYDGKIHFN